MRVSIMQPYLFPYLGYYRLFRSDLFVILDNVQFNRRGRVHRARMDEKRWLTLPLKKKDRNVEIRHLEWGNNAMDDWCKQVRKFPFLKECGINVGGLVNTNHSPLEIIVSSLAMTCDVLGLNTPSIFSSELKIDPALKSQDMIIAICKAAGADTYVNSPGGTGLYDPLEFSRHGIALEFLDPYADTRSVLERIAFDDINDLRKELA